MMTYVIELAEGDPERVQCNAVSLTQDGSVVFSMSPTDIAAIYAPGTWKKVKPAAIQTVQ